MQIAPNADEVSLKGKSNVFGLKEFLFGFKVGLRRDLELF